MRTIYTRSDVRNRTVNSQGSLMASAVVTVLIFAGVVVVSYPVTAAVTGGSVLALRYVAPRLVRIARTVDLSTTPQVEPSTNQTQQ